MGSSSRIPPTEGVEMPLYDDPAEGDRLQLSLDLEEQLQLELDLVEGAPTEETRAINDLMRHFHLSAEEAIEFYDEHINPHLGGDQS